MARSSNAPLSADYADALARIVTGGLFLALAVRIAQHVAETGRITALLLLASELLVVVLTVARRQATAIDRSVTARLVAALSMSGPLLVMPSQGPGFLPDIATAIVSAIGLTIVIGGKVSLGRSFGLMPANRGVVAAGLYAYVRHPIYAGYLVTHAAFVAANASFWNTTILAVADAGLIARAVREERILRRDPAYVEYLARVPWRLAPGIY